MLLNLIFIPYFDIYIGENLNYIGGNLEFYLEMPISNAF